MHYIRLLRPPSLVAGRQTVLSFVLTITTDLGDSFFSPATPLGIAVTLETESVHELPEASTSTSTSTSGQAETATRRHERQVFPIVGPARQPGGKAKAQTLAWSSGMRVLKMGLAVPDEAVAQLLDPAVVRRRVCFSMQDRRLCMLTAQDIVVGGGGGGMQAVVPLWVDVPEETGDEFPHVAVRRLCLGHVDGQAQEAVYVEVEEEMGESIARHVWDAGLATVAFLADTCMARDSRRRQREAEDDDNGALADALYGLLLAETGGLHVLELGSGVGILGIGLATILLLLGQQQQQQQDMTVLLTDLAEAEERATANMKRAEQIALTERTCLLMTHGGRGLDYENLDWDEGCRGRFGPKVAAGGQPWDLVVLSDCTYNVDMLPALVQTLSALQQLQAGSAQPMRVLLARKRRHADEEALFGLLADHGWEQRACGTVALPGEGDERLEVYLYEK